MISKLSASLLQWSTLLPTVIEECLHNSLSLIPIRNIERFSSLGMRKWLTKSPRVYSLIPRLPRSGMRTLKLCRRGEPGIFCHVKSGKDRREVDATKTEDGMKVAGNLLHVSSYRVLKIIHTECWSIVGWKTRKTLPFWSYFDYVMLT